MSKKVVFILSDALASEYPEDVQLHFLQKQINSNDTSYVKRIYPSTGYCEIVEYVSGLDSDDHRYFAQINVKKDWQQQSNRSSLLMKFIDTLFIRNPINKIRKVGGAFRLITDPFINWILDFYVTKEISRVRYKIPLQLLPFLEPTESKYKYDSDEFFGDLNLFSKLNSVGVSYDLSMFVEDNKIVGTDDSRMSDLLDKVVSKKLQDFTMLYLGYGEIAHFTGTESPYFHEKLKGYDSKLEELYLALEDNYDDFDLLIVGDHGMIDVNSSINMYPVLSQMEEELNLTRFEDYLFFLDSTLLRIWVKQEKMHLLPEINTFMVKALGESYEAEEKCIDYLNQFKKDYGDLIYMLKPGVMFFPDFFNQKVNKGMHGYFNYHKGQQGMLLHMGSNVQSNFRESMKLSEVRNYVLDIYGIPHD